MKDILRISKSTADYRAAVSGEGPEALNWKDKPHRLVYDLCSSLESVSEINKQVLTLLAKVYIAWGEWNASDGTEGPEWDVLQQTVFKVESFLKNNPTIVYSVL